MRKTVEALQAWRRFHQGGYPGRLADLKLAGLLPEESGICPSVLSEELGANPAHSKATSRGEGGDPEGTYEYELSDSNMTKRQVDGTGTRIGGVNFSRRDLKSELLRRNFAEQVPLLRCSSHRRPDGTVIAEDKTRRNITASGLMYWSGEYWEKNWLDQVPYCCRDANVLFGLKGPPFHTDRAPDSPNALDLRPWACAFGDDPWWWNEPIFHPDGQSNTLVATLRPLFEKQEGRAIALAGENWWLDGLVQLQGKTSEINTDAPRAYKMQCFVWEKKGLAVNRKVTKATWLQGTVWEAGAGDHVAALIWHYANGESAAPADIVYAQGTARFWTDAPQSAGQSGLPTPVWEFHETEKDVGEERTLRLYRQEWINPHPEWPVATLDFVSDQNCSASPFVVAINVYP